MSLRLILETIEDLTIIFHCLFLRTEGKEAKTVLSDPDPVCKYKACRGLFCQKKAVVISPWHSHLFSSLILALL